MPYDSLSGAADFRGRRMRQSAGWHDYQPGVEFYRGLKNLVWRGAASDHTPPFPLFPEMPAPQRLQPVPGMAHQALVRSSPLDGPVTIIAEVINRAYHMDQEQAAAITLAQTGGDFQRPC